MDNNIIKDDDIWDFVNEKDFDQCFLLEATQSAQSSCIPQNNMNDIPVKEESLSHHHWLSGKVSDFSIPKENGNSSKFPIKLDMKRDELSNNRKGFTGGQTFSFSTSIKNVSKKQNFYKPLDIGPSTSKCNDNLAGSKKYSEKIENSGENTSNTKGSSVSVDITLQKSVSVDITLQKQVELLQKENANLQEENLIKQGEVMNLRSEMKRKDTILESERIGHCLDLEAAEKRGKEKASKSLLGMEMKVKSLGKEVDKLEGNLLFKNQEVQELLSKCKLLDQQQKNHCTESSPKRRKIDTKLSSNKSINFSSRFDFGDVKRAVKTVETQTEEEIRPERQKLLHCNSKRRLFDMRRKAFYLMSTCQGDDLDPALDCEPSSRQIQSTLIAQMIASDSSIASGNNSELLLFKRACRELGKIIKEAKGDKKNTVDAISWVRVLSFSAANDSASHDGLSTLSGCLLAFLKERVPNTPALISILSSMTASANRGSYSPEEISVAVGTSLRECAGHVTSEELGQKYIRTLTEFLRFETFIRCLCVNKPDKCLLRKVYELFHKSSKTLASLQWTKIFTIFVTKLLVQVPNSFHANKDCNCSLYLLFTFVGQLFHTANAATTRKVKWVQLSNGIKALHLWQLKDPFWCDKTPHVSAYTPLLSLIVRNAQCLKTKGILRQQTWDLLYDLTT